MQTPSGLQLLRSAYHANMQHKMTRYAQLRDAAEEDVRREKDVLDMKQPQLRALSGARDDDNWSIFQTISQRYLEAQERATSFEANRLRASERLEALENAAKPLS